MVIGLLEKSSVYEGCTLTFDIFFTSLSLLDKLVEKKIGAVGTIRDNRLQEAPMMPKEMEKNTGDV